MDDFKILYDKAIGHRNALAVRNAALEFDLALAHDRVVELEKRLECVKITELSLAERAALVEAPEYW